MQINELTTMNQTMLNYEHYLLFFIFIFLLLIYFFLGGKGEITFFFKCKFEVIQGLITKCPCLQGIHTEYV